MFRPLGQQTQQQAALSGPDAEQEVGIVEINNTPYVCPPRSTGVIAVAPIRFLVQGTGPSAAMRDRTSAFPATASTIALLPKGDATLTHGTGVDARIRTWDPPV